MVKDKPVPHSRAMSDETCPPAPLAPPEGPGRMAFLPILAALVLLLIFGVRALVTYINTTHRHRPGKRGRRERAPTL